MVLYFKTQFIVHIMQVLYFSRTLRLKRPRSYQRSLANTPTKAVSS